MKWAVMYDIRIDQIWLRQVSDEEAKAYPPHVVFDKPVPYLQTHEPDFLAYGVPSGQDPVRQG